MRFRHVYMVLMTILVLAALFFTSPENGFITELPFGSGFIATIVLLLKAVINVSLLHISRKALFDYVDLEVFFVKSRETPEGSGMALVAIGLAMISVAILIAASV